MLTHPLPPPRAPGGFSLVELMTVVALMSLLLLAAIPSFTTWTRNATVRAAAAELQNALRTAQAEAVRRSRQVAFVLTNATTDAADELTPDAAGTRWAIVALPLLSNEESAVIEAGAVTDAASGFNISGEAGVLCFNSAGRLVANSNLSFTDTACAAHPGLVSFTLDMAGANKPLKVTVAPGGQVRLCDPARTLSSSRPDGCPS
ncbi:MAG: GspH/FimT family pseudopilin [Betaproteobacteria bacterium]|nr:GspH/FimT family pseudopilin [Betaproteobacteria bacterium]MCL2886034.1 GspH/FimT family pseudopilin [Betaproteobacteria bacterium]